MYLALAFFPEKDQYIIICSDLNGTMEGYETLTKAINVWKVDSNNPWAILSTVQLKVSIIKVKEDVQWIKEQFFDEQVTPISITGGFMRQLNGLLVNRNGKEAFDNGYIVRE